MLSDSPAIMGALVFLTRLAEVRKKAQPGSPPRLTTPKLCKIEHRLKL